ncbi:MAG: thioesterase family protein, partial [Acidimicrobiia bacterium]
IERVGDGRWTATPSDRWSIGDTANGGYAASIVLRAMADVAAHPDPLSVTTHFLRPLQPDGDTATVEAEVVRAGRTTSVVRGQLSHTGRGRLTVLGAFGELAEPASDAPGAIDAPAPDIPGPDDCRHRSSLEQGVALSILDRLDVRIHPDRADDSVGDAVMEGWIRFVDGTEPSTLALPLFADAFPPSLFARYGRVGWVPTIELTVHVRRRPAAGWIQARFECDDLVDGRMIETGTLWDATGAVVARSRQLGLLLT